MADKKNRLGLVLLGFLVLGIAMNIQFGDSGGHHHGFNLNEQGFYLLDFVIFITVLGAFVVKPARTFLENRHEAIRLEMAEAADLLKESKGQLDLYEGQLNGLPDESKRLQEDFRQDGEREKARLEKDTDDALAKIKRDLSARVDQESARVRDEVYRHVSSEALRLAEEKIRKQLDQATQRRLVGQYLGDLKRIGHLGEIRRTTG
jgi:F-type H+-transporting ATPase subunit b